MVPNFSRILFDFIAGLKNQTNRESALSNIGYAAYVMSSRKKFLLLEKSCLLTEKRPSQKKSHRLKGNKD
jgi:hypothetical protein